LVFPTRFVSFFLGVFLGSSSFIFEVLSIPFIEKIDARGSL